jgi:hypothetical protein
MVAAHNRHHEFVLQSRDRKALPVGCGGLVRLVQDLCRERFRWRRDHIEADPPHTAKMIHASKARSRSAGVRQ